MAKKKKKPAAKKAKAAAKVPPKPPVEKKSLTTEKAREAALDRLGAWIVDALAAAGSDKKLATKILTVAIKTFYDIRESAGQERGEYAGHFFMVDAVGIEDSSRPVPWEKLAKRASEEDLEMYGDLLSELESEIS